MNVSYWLVRVKIQIEHDSGKIQNVVEQYLVAGENPTDVEAKITSKFEGEEFTITGITKSRILGVVQ